ncbi:hypothetical protein EV401DRAFT_1943561, partial [Pisolithus croceorrhizus]
ISTQEEQLIELMLTLKNTTPDQARSILASTPQIAYALITLIIKMNAVDVQVLQENSHRAFHKRTSTTCHPTSLRRPPSLLPTVQSYANSTDAYPNTLQRTRTSVSTTTTTSAHRIYRPSPVWWRRWTCNRVWRATTTTILDFAGRACVLARRAKGYDHACRVY